MKRLLAGIVVVGALFAISPGLASANTVTPECNGGGAGSCDGWFNAAALASAPGNQIAFDWIIDPTADGGTLGSCDPQTFSAEGDHSITCTASWTTGSPSSDTETAHVKIDVTAPTVSGANPSETASAAGWFNAPLDFQFTGSDATSGIGSCQSKHYAGGDNANASVSGTCTDVAGNTSAPLTVPFKYDATPPVVTGATPSRAASPAGWYNAPLDFQFAGTDGLSGIGPGGCQAKHYAGGDNADATVSGTCTDLADNTSSSFTFHFHYDATPPNVTSVAPTRAPDSNGWYNHPVTFSASGNDALSGVLPGSCAGGTYSGPPSNAAVVQGSCVDNAGNLGIGSSAPFKYDSVPPEITGANASRAPDYNGWYNHPVSFTFTGADGVSGIAPGSCSTVTYSGGDSSKATVKGSCRDVAGNTGSGSQTFKYDSTPPGKATLKAVPGNHTIDLSWSLPSDATGVTVLRSPQSSAAAPATVYRGTASAFTDKKLTNGVKYRYTVIDNDQAGNTNTQTIVIAPTASSLRPLVGAIVSSAPFLSWKKVKKATYYNLQLYRGSKKVLSIWPHKHYLQVGKKWRYAGKKYTLKKGHYRWYVWPGFGAEKRHKYGKLLGASTFRVI